jgi:Na+/H+ antiporter NhaD/arsenite permease-like protein
VPPAGGALRPDDARAAAAYDWSPFVLVAGLVLIGIVADDDGLFAAAGHRLARVTRSGSALFIGAAVLIGVMTAVLNLDSSVAFLTPVLVSADYRGRFPWPFRGPPDVRCLVRATWETVAGV